MRKKRAQIMTKKKANEQEIGNYERFGIEVLTPTAMGVADRLTIERGVPGYQLMQAAGQAVADHALATGATRVLVLAGPGNNGGDGLVAAKRLAAAGRSVDVALLGNPEKLAGDAATAFGDYSGPVVSFSADDADDVVLDAELIIDALFGAGLTRGVTGGPGRLIERVNRSEATVLAVDLPSGVDGESGLVSGAAINADLTVTFFRLKPGHLLYPGRSLCGRTHVEQIGIHASALADINSPLRLNIPALWVDDMRVPTHESHKYSRGHALIVSGPPLNTGASRLAARAALRVGSGLVTIAADTEAAHVHAAHLSAIMIRTCHSAGDLARHLSDPRFTSVLVGPAAGVDDKTREMVEACLGSTAAVVLDADALTVFADSPDCLFKQIGERSAPVVLTPHSGEFARLFGEVADLPGAGDSGGSTAGEHHRMDAAAAAANRSGAIVLLKGADTIVAEPSGRISIAANAPPWLATAGSGDVLAGVVAGLMAQGMPAFEATSAAVWLHGEAGSAGGPGLTADDLPGLLRPGLSRVLKSLKTG